ncbi:hypothetical protein DB31_2570 [Hyalangium minutum]|uniref:Uncharacterized protein n=1 Tax=Hyalangium minutum TaxID=394096 RepID=A0A085W6Y9_9BACT|nr:hypothetical protein DB31_2570 [Hyalangium minutum]
MRCATRHAVPIVVDLVVAVAPDDVDWKIRGEAETDGGPQAQGPGLNGSEGRARPVERRDKRRHFAASGEPFETPRACAHIEFRSRRLCIQRWARKAARSKSIRPRGEPAPEKLRPRLPASDWLRPVAPRRDPEHDARPQSPSG